MNSSFKFALLTFVVLSLSLSSLGLVSCQKSTKQVDDSTAQELAYPIAELLSAEFLRSELQISSVNEITCLVDDAQAGVQYEWPLNSPEFIEEANRERARLSLLDGQVPALILSSARVTLNKRACEMNLVELKERLSQDADLSKEDLPQALRVGNSGGLWCPEGRVLHFDTPSGALSLGVELGGGLQQDFEVAVQLASGILSRSEKGFFAQPESQDSSEESWITLE